MKLITQKSWPEIYEIWKRTETEKDYWRAHFERKGFKDWDDFREDFIEKQKETGVDLKNLKWEEYEINAEELAEFECVNHKKWNELAEKIGSRKLKDLSTAEHFKNHDKIEDLKQNFPEESHLIGVKKDGKIMLIEGHHRAIAICHLLKQGNTISKKIFLYLA